MRSAPNRAPRLAASASTFDGFYFRGSLGSKGTVPAAPPYDLCPDIVRSGTPIPDAQAALSTAESWQTLYDCEPAIAIRNFYYLRGMNGAIAPVSDALRLYWAPAQLILFPPTWRNQPMAAASGDETVEVSARPGEIGVGGEPFVWTPPPLPAGSTFHSFVAQASGAGSEPVTANDWIGMSQLLTQRLDLGFRNLAYVDPGAAAWLHRLGITIPGTVGEPATLMLTVTASGFAGCTLGLLVDRFTAEQEMIALEPVTLADGFTTGLRFTLEAGFTGNLTVQCWNPGPAVAAGSAITLSVSYVVPEARIAEAVQRGGLDSRSSAQVADAAQVGPTPVLPLGSVSFVAGLTPFSDD
jgi:hypothetical protein